MLGDRRRAIATYAAIVVGYAALLATVFVDVWYHQKFFGWDCLREYWPDIVFQLHALQDGELPMWNPYSLGGYPFHGDPQAGFLSPVNWLCWVLGAVSGNHGPWLIVVKVLVSMFAALVGMHLLVRKRTGSEWAAVVAAVLFLLGSPLLVHKNGAFLWPFCWLPLAVLALERFHELPSARRAALLAGAIWLCGSAGHPQGFFYDLVIVGLYWTFLTVSHGRRDIVRQARGLAVLVPLTLLLLLPIYLPSLEAVAASPRADRGPDYVLGGGMPAAALRELVVANLDKDWQLDIYMGPLALVAALYAAFAARDRRARADRIFWIGVALLGVLLAMSRAGHVLPWFVKHVPGFDLFRIAYRHKLIFGFAAALLAGEGVAAVARRDGPKWARFVFLALMATWLIVALGLGAKANGLVRPLLMLGLLAVALFVARTAKYALPVVALLALTDLWSAGTTKIAILQPPPDPRKDAALVAKLPGVKQEWRYHSVNAAMPYHTPYLNEVREFSGFLNPITLKRQEDVVAAAKRLPALLAHFNVRYLVGGSRPPGARPVPGISAAEITDTAPLVRVYARAESVTAKEMLARLGAVSPSALAAVLVDPADLLPATLPHGEFAPVDGSVVRYRRNRIDVQVDVPAGGGIAVLNEAWYPGWTARVNGQPAQVFRANYFLRAVVVPEGQAVVTFVFEPRAYKTMLLLFVLALAAIGVALFGRWPWLTRATAR